MGNFKVLLYTNLISTIKIGNQICHQLICIEKRWDQQLLLIKLRGVHATLRFIILMVMMNLLRLFKVSKKNKGKDYIIILLILMNRPQFIHLSGGKYHLSQLLHNAIYSHALKNSLVSVRRSSRILKIVHLSILFLNQTQKLPSGSFNSSCTSFRNILILFY